MIKKLEHQNYFYNMNFQEKLCNSLSKINFNLSMLIHIFNMDSTHVFGPASSISSIPAMHLISTCFTSKISSNIDSIIREYIFNKVKMI